MTIAHHRTHKIPNGKDILVAMLVAGLATSGMLGWAKLKQVQEEKIQQAQIQLTEVCQSNIDSNASAIEASRKVDESTNLLQSIPQIPGLGYQTAQDQLTSFSPCIQTIKKTEDLFAAKQLSQAALAVNSTTIHSVAEWRTLQSNLEQSIALLKDIPEDIDIYTEAQQDLQLYQTQLGTINQRLTYEAEADHAFERAEQLNQLANTILANSSDDTALSEAETQLEGAIQWLKTIPEGHRVSAKSQENLVAYQQELANIHYQRATNQLRPFVDSFYDFTTSLDTTLTYHTYSEQLKQFNDRFYALTESYPEILNHPAAQASQKALNQCNDAMNVWRYCHEGNCYTSWEANIPDWREDVLWIPASFQIGDSSLAQTYSIPVDHNIWTQHYVQQNLALSTIWEAAKQNAATARDTINK